MTLSRDSALDALGPKKSRFLAMAIFASTFGIDASERMLAMTRAAEKPRRGTFTELMAEVAERHDVTIAELVSPSRLRRVAHPRQELMAMAHAAGFSQPFIARQLGGRDHTTILHGIRAHKARVGQ